MYRLLRFRFEGEGGGDGDPAGGGGPAPSGAGGGGGEGGGGEPKPVTMTQTQLDQRLTRAASSALEKQAKDAGFDSHDAMVNAAKAAKAAEAANQTELERAQAAAATAAQERDATRQALEAERVSGAFFIAATAAKIPADRLSDALALLDRSAITIVDGQPVGVDEAVKVLVETKPYIVGPTVQVQQPVGAGGDGGARGGGGAATVDPALADMAAKFGLNPTKVAEAATAKTPEATASYLEQRMKDFAPKAKA